MNAHARGHERRGAQRVCDGIPHGFGRAAAARGHGPGRHRQPPAFVIPNRIAMPEHFARPNCLQIAAEHRREHDDEQHGCASHRAKPKPTRRR